MVSSLGAYVFDDVGRATSVVRTGPGASDANYSYTSAGRLLGAAWSTGAGGVGRDWWRREEKRDFGYRDIEIEFEVDEIYQDWIDMGRPTC